MKSKNALRHISPLLDVEGLSVDFRVENVWRETTHDVSFTVGAGRTVALVGESGSGKSVTAMALMGLLPPSARVHGSAKFEGEQIIGMRGKDLRHFRSAEVGMIFQEPMTALNPVYTIGHQITRAIRSHAGSTNHERRERVIELLKLVSMPEPSRRIDHYPHQLSGGQSQRAVIAIALASNPKLLIADEPTTALDVTVQTEILELIEGLQAKLGMALLIITHNMGVVAEIADDVVVMRNGKTVEHRTVHDLFAAPQHEYTRKLLASVPHLGQPEQFDFLFARETQPSAIPSLEVNDSQSLKVEDLTVVYRGHRRSGDYTAVRGVTFDIAPGETVGLVGESGSGKSTIGRTVLGLNDIAAGDITLLGKSIKGCSHKQMRQLRKETGMVFQDPASSLNPRVPIGLTVVDPLRLHSVERSPKRLRARACELLDSVELPSSWTDRYPHELSGGQRQRVAIARAISMTPKILVADEPTSALDVCVQATVLALLKGLQAELGFSCLFISHDLAVVEILADRIIVLNQGAIVEQGSVNQILNDPQDAYTRKLIAAVPVPDPEEQRARRAQRLICSGLGEF